jgi:hypothetical protein
MPYLLFFQPVDDKTDPANAALSGEVFDLEELLTEKGAGRSSCDGQVSPTPPRYSDDNMMGMYFESKEVAEEFSAVLRGDVRRRIARGELTLNYQLPWQTTEKALWTTASVEKLAKSAATKYYDATDSQILSAAEACAIELGRLPTADELFFWIEQNRSW